MRTTFDEWPEVELGSLRYRPNILLIGSDAAAAPLLSEMLSRCRQPVHEVRDARVAAMPDRGTVVLRDLPAFDQPAQRAVLEWLDARGADVQVISLATSPVFPLVADGDFSETLFYRLNVVTLHVNLVSQPSDSSEDRVAAGR